MGQKHEKFREFRKPLPPRYIRKNPRSMYARVPQTMAQFALKIELLSHIMGTTPILEMARAYGLRPRLWLLAKLNNWTNKKIKKARDIWNVHVSLDTYYKGGENNFKEFV